MDTSATPTAFPSLVPSTGNEDLNNSTPSQIVERATEAAREMLGMDMAYLADTRDGLQDYSVVTGDGESFGATPGRAVPLEGTYCEMVLDGRLDGIVHDARRDPRVSELSITEAGRIGSYIGVPVVLGDGSAYGTLCCLSHEPKQDLSARDLRFMRLFGRLVAEQLQRAEIERERHRLAMTAGNVNALLAALEARDGYTEAHSVAVLELALEVGGELGLGEEDLRDLESAALLHDIGKIGVPDAVLRKPDKLTDEEWVEMRRHPEIGERIIASMPPLAHLAPVIRAEHERWDGGGYPDGLRGEQIPLASRIVFACDAYHAITSDRPYRKALSRDVALRELRDNAGTQFCPLTVAAIERLVDRSTLPS